MNKPARAMTIGLVLLVASLLIGAGGIVSGLIRTNQLVGEMNLSDPVATTGLTSTSLLTIVIGMIVAVIGLCLFVGGLIAHVTGRSPAPGAV